MYKSWNYYK